MDMIKYLNESAIKQGIELPHYILDQFQEYYLMLIDWNKKMNLTAITDPKEVAIKHFLDCICVTKYVNIPDESTLIDVGTGAGLPGIPIKLVNKSINLTLLDSLNKRLTFLKAVDERINLNANIIHSRAEDGGRDKNLREKFDISISRAVAKLNVLSEYCLPFAKVGGKFIAMKGPNVDEEVKEAEIAINKLGGKISDIIKFNLPEAGDRSIVVIEKVKKTDKMYPRRGVKIKKDPI